MFSTDEVMYGKTKLIIFVQMDNTFSWVDVLLVSDKI